jgi:hypothetical protein
VISTKKQTKQLVDMVDKDVVDVDWVDPDD